MYNPNTNIKLDLKIGIVGGEVQLGPLGTEATNRSMPAPDDYDDGGTGEIIIGRGN
jgi:hypothetical protein